MKDQGADLVMSYFLDYGSRGSLGRQVYTQAITPGLFVREIAPCRTFLLEDEAEQLRRQGMGAHLTLADILVFGARGPIENTLRFSNEPARHKVLDMVGDLSLLGADLCGHLVACRSGHPLNVALAQELHKQMIQTLGRTMAA
jgi:UDP-3-O-acyl-N-acetylglucosamine deacetylase